MAAFRQRRPIEEFRRDALMPRHRHDPLASVDRAAGASALVLNLAYRRRSVLSPGEMRYFTAISSQAVLLAAEQRRIVRMGWRIRRRSSSFSDRPYFGGSGVAQSAYIFVRRCDRHCSPS